MSNSEIYFIYLVIHFILQGVMGLTLKFILFISSFILFYTYRG